MRADVPEQAGRVRLTDAPGVARTIATAFATTRTQAIAVLPIWMLPHTGRLCAVHRCWSGVASQSAMGANILD